MALYACCYAVYACCYALCLLLGTSMLPEELEAALPPGFCVDTNNVPMDDIYYDPDFYDEDALWDTDGTNDTE